MKRVIYVAGYPKSGNTWLSRLLGEAYEAPVARWRSALPLACEGEARVSDTVVHQLHLKPVAADAPAQSSAIEHAYWWDWRQPLRSNERIVFIVRDVRDVIVSAFHYWQRETVVDAANAVVLGYHPLQVHGSWTSFNESWIRALEQTRDDIMIVKYEQLLKTPLAGLDVLTLGEFDVSWLNACVERQSFAKTRERIEQDGDKRPYGKEVQLRNLRKGVAGDWVNHFDSTLAQFVEKHCGRLLRELGYYSPVDWWKNV